MDVKSGFLNCHLEEEVSMYHPEGFQAVEKERMVCRLVKSLDGFRKRPRVWYIKIAKNL